MEAEENETNTKQFTQSMIARVAAAAGDSPRSLPAQRQWLQLSSKSNGATDHWECPRPGGAEPTQCPWMLISGCRSPGNALLQELGHRGVVGLALNPSVQSRSLAARQLSWAQRSPQACRAADFQYLHECCMCAWGRWLISNSNFIFQESLIWDVTRQLFCRASRDIFCIRVWKDLPQK